MFAFLNSTNSSIFRGCQHPVKEIKARIVTEVPDKNDTVKLYCNSGRQSGQAKDMLTEMGYTQVTNEGGINQIALPKVENK